MYFISGMAPQGAGAITTPSNAVSAPQQLSAGPATAALPQVLSYPQGNAGMPMTTLTQQPYYQLVMPEGQAPTPQQAQLVSPTGLMVMPPPATYARTGADGGTVYAVPVASLPTTTTASNVTTPAMPSFVSVGHANIFSASNTTAASTSLTGHPNLPPAYTDLQASSVLSGSLMLSSEAPSVNSQYSFSPLSAALIATGSPYERPRPAAAVELPVRNVGLRGYEAGVYYEGRVKRYNASRGYGFLCASHKFVPLSASADTAASARGTAGREPAVMINGVAHTRQRVTVNDIFVHQRSLISSAPPAPASDVTAAAAAAAVGATGATSVLVDLQAGSLVRFRAEVFMPANVASYVDSDREAVMSSIGLGGSKDASVLNGAILTEKGWGFQAVEVQLLPPRGALAPDDDVDLAESSQPASHSPSRAAEDDNSFFGAQNSADASEEERRRLGRAGLVRHDPSVRVRIPLNPPPLQPQFLSQKTAHLPPPPAPLPMYCATPVYGTYAPTLASPPHGLPMSGGPLYPGVFLF